MRANKGGKYFNEIEVTVIAWAMYDCLAGHSFDNHGVYLLVSSGNVA